MTLPPNLRRSLSTTMDPLYRSPLVKYIGWRRDGKMPEYTSDWTTYPVLPPGLITQLVVGPDMTPELTSRLFEYAGGFVHPQDPPKPDTHHVETLSFIIMNRKWGEKFENVLKEMMKGAIKFLEIRGVWDDGSESAWMEDRTASPARRYSFVARPADNFDEAFLKHIRGIEAPGPQILHIRTPRAPSRFFMHKDRCIATIAQALRLSLDLQKCVLTLDFAMQIEQLLRCLPPSCEELELLAPTSFEFTKLAHTAVNEIVHKLAVGLAGVGHLKVVALPVMSAAGIVLDQLNGFPCLQVLRIRPMSGQDTIPYFLESMRILKREGALRRLKVLNVITTTEAGLDEKGLRELYKMFPSTIVYQPIAS